MNARLVILGGAKKGSEFELTEGVVTLGREDTNQFSFGSADDVVSGTHASIRFDHLRYVIKDEGSRNGTFVNNRRVQEQELRHGDLIEFGMGGPTARFEVGEAGVAPAAGMGGQATQHVGKAGTVTRLLRDARQVSGGSPTMVMKEFVKLAYKQSGRRARRMSIAVAVVALGVTGGVWAKAEMDRRAADEQIRAAGEQISGLTTQLQQGDERRAAIRAELENLRQENVSLSSDLASVQAQSQRIRRELEEAQARVEENRNVVGEISDQYSGSVAFLSFGYGWHNPNGQILRHTLDAEGRILIDVNEAGDTVYVLEPDGNGPAYGGSDGSSCTGFLIDQDGWLVTNRHCAEPWLFGEEYWLDAPVMEAAGWEMRFIGGGPEVYFPDDVDGLRADVHAVSEEADVALLRISPVSRTAIPLGAPSATPGVGENLVLAGYPTGLRYIAQARVPNEDREAYQAAWQAGEDLRFLIDRGLLYPFVAVGRVNDLAAGEIMHDANTYGGASGSPVLGEGGYVVGVHHASNPFDISPRTGMPIRGTDFTVKYAAQVQFVWDLLPQDVRGRLSAN